MSEKPKEFVLSVASWPQAIAHIDADAFFVACEVATNPTLKDKNVVVGKERGIVTALSYSAKAKGIKRGMLISEAKRICPDLVVVESDYEKYSMFSVRMFEILRNFSPVVEEYSIDEAFVDLTGLRRIYNTSYLGIARLIQDEIEKRIGISVSIGVAPTKVLAKIASKMNKPHGLVAIEAKSIHRYLKQVNVEDVWGIGKNTASLLNKLGIYTALDFARAKEEYLKRFLSKPYMEIYHELRGESVLKVDPNKKSTYKSISKSKSFSKPTSDKEKLLGELIRNLENACMKVRMYKLAARKLIVFLKTHDYQTSYVKLKLKNATNVPLLFVDTLKKAFEMIYDENLFYRQTGVILGDLTTKQQYTLFENKTKIDKIIRLYKAVDELNKRFGRSKIHIAREEMALIGINHTQRMGIEMFEVDI